MEICALESADLPQILDIERECFPDPWSTAQFTETLDHPTTQGWTVRVDGLCIGYAIVRVMADEAELLSVAIAWAHHRQGCGRVLLASVLEWCQTHAIMRCFLEVRAGNRAAHQFYEALGFVRMGLRQDYYHTPIEDAVCYAWQDPAQEKS
jgi:[ribosomal protein S18]-alanine N-acetyltransferase